MRVATKPRKLDGKALKVAESINTGDDPALIMRRFARFCQLVGGQQRAKVILAEMGKSQVIATAQQAVHQTSPAVAPA